MNEETLRDRLKGSSMAVVGGAIGAALVFLIALGANTNRVHTGAGQAYLDTPVLAHPGK